MDRATTTDTSCTSDATAPRANQPRHESSSSTATTKLRKRSKTGCLTCRKRRIKCGEERPTCANCIKSKRQCEGYNQRVIFKPPIGDWPNHPGVLSSIQYHTSMLPGTRNPQCNNAALEADRPLPRLLCPSDQALCTATYFPRPMVLAAEVSRYDRLNHQSSSIPYQPIDLPQPYAILQGYSHRSGPQSCRFADTQSSKILSQAPHIAVVSQERDWWGSSQSAPISPFKNATLPLAYYPFLPGELPDLSRYASVSESTSAGHVPPYVVITQSKPQIITGSRVDEDSMRGDRVRLLDRLMAQLMIMLSTRSCSETTDENGSDGISDTSGEDETSERGLDTRDSDVMSTASGCTAPYDQDSSSQAPSQSRSSTTTGSTSRDSRHARINSNGKRPKLRSEGDENHSDEEDALRKRNKPNANFCNAELDPRKFACPFFQRNPERHTGRRSCVGPGFTTVHRVKEHCRRHHRQRLHCPRCKDFFGSEALLLVHQEADVACEKSSTVRVPEGLSASQVEALRSRKRRSPEFSEKEKWVDMYRIIFPADSSEKIPSPYVDFTWEAKLRQGSGNNELNRYEQFLRDRLPDAVRSELETAIEHELSFQGRAVSQLVQIVRDQQLRLFQVYTGLRASEVHITDPEAQTTTLGARISGLETRTPVEDFPTPTALQSDRHLLRANSPDMLWGENSVLEGLAAQDAALYASEPLNLEFNAIQFEIHDRETFAQDFPDSAYGSISFEREHVMTDMCGSDMWINEFES